uniref:Uncharacterized protein n=1 Tax=Anguilla anguilla TaxID=7936 RepID=A0A0E9SWW9_ANGAN
MDPSPNPGPETEKIQILSVTIHKAVDWRHWQCYR